MQHNIETGDRVGWVDYVKGICIVWVVTMYATDRVRRALQRCWQFTGRLSPPQASVVEQERGSLIQQQLKG